MYAIRAKNDERLRDYNKIKYPKPNKNALMNMLS